MSTEKALLGLLAGFAAGATLGILFAPDKGTATRKRIVQQGDDYVSEMEEKFKDLLSNVTDKYESLKGKTVQLAENGRAKFEEKLHEKM